MDLVEFRTKHPGLYQEAFEAGVEAEADRQQRVRAIASSVGASPDRALERGWTPAEAADHYRQFAGRSDESAAAFMRAVRGALTTSPRSDDDLDIDALVARLHGAPPAPSGNSSRATTTRGGSGAKDLGDLFAETLPPPRSVVNDFASAGHAAAEGDDTHHAPAATRPNQGARDIGDLFAESLKPAAREADGGAP